MSEITLPTKPTKYVDQSPTNLVIFSKPKTGKTSLLAGLPDCLILDFEDGTRYVEAMRIHIDSIETLSKTAQAIQSEKEARGGVYPYQYIGVDTITAMEDMAVGYAEILYSRSPMGKRWFEPSGGKEKYGNILNMPDGAGYNWLRQAFNKMLELIHQLAPRVILCGHIKDIFLDKEDNKFSALELDLTGKLKRSVAANYHSIGYLIRKGNKTILSFKTSDEVVCGARPEHLSNQEIVISEKINGKVYTYWDKIFLDLPEQERPPKEEKESK